MKRLVSGLSLGELSTSYFCFSLEIIDFILKLNEPSMSLGDCRYLPYSIHSLKI